MVGDHLQDVVTDREAAIVGEPELEHACVEAERLASGQPRVERRVDQFLLERFPVEFGRFGEETVAGGHQVVAHAREFPDVFAFPEHHLVGLPCLFVLGETTQRVV